MESPANSSQNSIAIRLPLSISISFGLIAFLIIVENVSVCMLIIFMRRRLWSYCNGFVFSLAVSDTLVGCVFIPAYIHHPAADLNGYLVAIVLFTNIANILGVTTERYIAILRALRYETLMAKSFKPMLIAVWLTPILISLAPLCWKTDTKSLVHNVYLGFLVCVCMVMPFVYIVWAYCKIFKEVRRQLKKMQSLDVTHKDRRKIHGEGKMARVFVVITGLFICGWLPVIIMTIFILVQHGELIVPELSIASMYTLSLNAAANPLVYAFLKTDIKTALHKVLKSMIHSETNMANDMYTTAVETHV